MFEGHCNAYYNRQFYIDGAWSTRANPRIQGDQPATATVARSDLDGSAKDVGSAQWPPHAEPSTAIPSPSRRRLELMERMPQPPDKAPYDESHKQFQRKWERPSRTRQGLADRSASAHRAIATC